MKIEKFLGSKSKTDILKYLLFKRQGVSVRALESELDWTFPAIKKQIDILLDSNVLSIDKNSTKWSIYIQEDSYLFIKNILFFSLEQELKDLFDKYDTIIENYFLGSTFGKDINADIVLIYKSIGKDHLEKIKEDISDIFRGYFIENIGVASLTSEDFQRRYRLADKFVLNLISA